MPRLSPLPEPVTDEPTLARFIAFVAASLADGSFNSLLLCKHRGPVPDLQRVTVRTIVLREQHCLSFAYRHTTRDVTKNLSLTDGLHALREMLGAVFRNAHLHTHLHTQRETVELAISQRGVCTLRRARGEAPAAGQSEAGAGTNTAPRPAAHDREKQRLVDVTRPFLCALGVTTAQHAVVPAMSRKWKQINKFVEVFAAALQASHLLDAASVSASAAPPGPRPLRVVDFGAGKGYLTFAVHDHLQQQPGIEAQVTGVELRSDMVRLGNAVVQQLGLVGLRFDEGDVRSRAVQPIDVMIALHACDTATDHAIHLGIRAGATIILCSPCCHKQLRPQLLSPHPLRSVFQHGIHAEQQAEMVTDSLRALLLESQGYETQVFEFVSLEHTAKNKMILAIKREVAQPSEAAWAQVDELKRYFGVKEQALESLLRT